MAVGHIAFDRSTVHGAKLSRGLQMLKEAKDVLNEVFATLNQMKDGDGSVASHFTYATSKFGFGSDANTKAGYDELNSLLSKLNTDASVTAVDAAMKQAFAKFG